MREVFSFCCTVSDGTKECKLGKRKISSKSNRVDGSHEGNDATDAGVDAPNNQWVRKIRSTMRRTQWRNNYRSWWDG